MRASAGDEEAATERAAAAEESRRRRRRSGADGAGSKRRFSRRRRRRAGRRTSAVPAEGCRRARRARPPREDRRLPNQLASQGGRSSTTRQGAAADAARARHWRLGRWRRRVAREAPPREGTTREEGRRTPRRGEGRREGRRTARRCCAREVKDGAAALAVKIAAGHGVSRRRGSHASLAAREAPAAETIADADLPRDERGGARVARSSTPAAVRVRGSPRGGDARSLPPRGRNRNFARR